MDVYRNYIISNFQYMSNISDFKEQNNDLFAPINIEYLLPCLYYFLRFYISEIATTVLRVFHLHNLLQNFECVQFPASLRDKFRSLMI